MDAPRVPGKTTIDPGVLLSIARLSTLTIEGVRRMGEVPGSVRGLFRRNHDKGVMVDIEDGRVDVDVYVILEAETEIRTVSRRIQIEIARAISEMVGMEVGVINVHIDDIDFAPDQDDEGQD